MSESARNPIAQAARRGDLSPLTKQQRSDARAKAGATGYLQYLANQVESPAHFEQVIAAVHDNPAGMRAGVRSQLLAMLPRRVIRMMVEVTGES